MLLSRPHRARSLSLRVQQFLPVRNKITLL
jgi:hypothetical protein